MMALLPNPGLLAACSMVLRYHGSARTCSSTALTALLPAHAVRGMACCTTQPHVPSNRQAGGSYQAGWSSQHCSQQYQPTTHQRASWPRNLQDFCQHQPVGLASLVHRQRLPVNKMHCTCAVQLTTARPQQMHHASMTVHHMPHTTGLLTSVPQPKQDSRTECSAATTLCTLMASATAARPQPTQPLASQSNLSLHSTNVHMLASDALLCWQLFALRSQWWC